MLQLIVDYTDTVKAIDVAALAKPIHPTAGRFHYLPPFTGGDRLERTPEGDPAAHFHFDKGDERATPRDEVDLDATHAKAMADDVPAARLQVTDGLFFTGEPPLVARVRPGCWIAVNTIGHGHKLAGRPLCQ
jgi:hypothetical protein